MNIFAKVNVDLLTHQRLMRIPRKKRGPALGAWLAGLLYTRKHELDGFCPLEALESFATDDVVAELVRVELVSRDEQDGVHGVILLRYAEHNDTRADIQARRAYDRKRKSKRFPTGSGPGDGSEFGSEKPSGSVPISDRNSHRSSEDFPSSPSASVSESLEGRASRGDLRTPSPGERYVAPDDPLTPELEAIAQQNAVQDVGKCWRTFCGKRAGKLVHVAGDFQAWCIRWASFERKDRDQAYARRNGGAPPAEPSERPKPTSDDELRRTHPQLFDAEFDRLMGGGK